MVDGEQRVGKGLGTVSVHAEGGMHQLAMSSSASNTMEQAEASVCTALIAVEHDC